MTITITCDYCGKKIDRVGTQTITIVAEGDKGGPKRKRWKGGYVGHYHSEPCYERILESIREVHEEAKDALERIPVATAEQIADWKPGDEGAEPLDFEPIFKIRLMEVPRTGNLHEIPEVRPSLADLGLYFPNERRVYDRVKTLGELRRAINDESLLSVKQIGPKRFAEIAKVVERIYAAGVEAVA